MHHQRQPLADGKVGNHLELWSADGVGSMRRDATLHDGSFEFAQSRDFCFQLLKVLVCQSRIGTKRFLKHYAAQTYFTQRIHTFKTGIAGVGHARHARARRLARAQGGGHAQIVSTHPLQSRERQFPEPRKKIPSSFSRKPRIAVNSRCECAFTKPGHNHGFTKIMHGSGGKLFDESVAITYRGNLIVIDCDRAVS